MDRSGYGPAVRRLAPLLCLALACRDGGTKPIGPTPTPPAPRCGDGTIDPGEDCDLSDLAGATCQSLGYDTGQLLCDSTCHFQRSLCVKRCGNGVLDPGEACDGALGVPACGSWGANRCTATCTVDTAPCVPQAFEAGPAVAMPYGGPAVLGDVSPRGPGDLVMAVPARGRLEALPWVTQLGFDATTSRKLSFQRTPRQPGAADLDGDGNQDLVAINDDGSIDAFLFTGTSFAPRTWPDAGCLGGHLVGRGRFRPDGGEGLVAAGCGDQVLALTLDAAQVLTAPGLTAVALGDLSGDGLTDLLTVDQANLAVLWAAPGFAADGGLPLTVPVSAAALGDLDGDGDLDLAVVSGNDVKLLENTGLGFADRLTFTSAAPHDVVIADFDLDGRPDVFWATGDEVVVRRNRGGWQWLEFRAVAGPGPRVSTSVGDADGDGDLDVAVTVSTGADSTLTYVVRNRTR